MNATFRDPPNQSNPCLPDCSAGGLRHHSMAHPTAFHQTDPGGSRVGVCLRGGTDYHNNTRSLRRNTCNKPSFWHTAPLLFCCRVFAYDCTALHYCRLPVVRLCYLHFPCQRKLSWLREPGPLRVNPQTWIPMSLPSAWPTILTFSFPSL